MSNNEPDYKDNLAFDAKKSKNKDWMIEDFVDLLMPEYITTEEECWNNINKAQKTLNELKEYQIRCVKKLAQLKKEKVIVKQWNYGDVLAYDYHVAKDINNISVDTLICDDIVEYGDGYDTGDYDIEEDYTNE